MCGESGETSFNDPSNSKKQNHQQNVALVGTDGDQSNHEPPVTGHQCLS